jgi:hypothetical protein
MSGSGENVVKRQAGLEVAESEDSVLDGYAAPQNHGRP